MRDKINGFWGHRNKCKLSSDGSYIDLTSPDGYDIVIDGFDLPNQTRNVYNTTLTIANPGVATGADPFISGDHSFQNGDVVRVGLASNETSTGLIHGQHYVVKDVADNDGDGVNDRFKLATYDANGTATTITMSAAAAQNVTFTKVEKGFKLQAMDRDSNLKGTL